MRAVRWLTASALLVASAASGAPAIELPAVPTTGVRLQLGARDLLHDVGVRLERWIGGAPAPNASASPDLTSLTTAPIDLEQTEHSYESSGFGWRNDPIRHDRRYHGGADFRADPGTPVKCAGGGVVVFAGRQGGYGNVIYVDHGGGLVTRYAHLRRIVTKLEAHVSAGELIGEVGSTGRATGPHLHFEVRLDGRAVDPVTAMTVAELERLSPDAGRIAALALAPALQAHVVNREDQGSSRAARPDRPGRSKRDQALW